MCACEGQTWKLAVFLSLPTICLCISGCVLFVCWCGVRMCVGVKGQHWLSSSRCLTPSLRDGLLETLELINLAWAGWAMSSKDFPPPSFFLTTS